MDEKLSILKMVEEGKITVDEAAKLLDALGKKNEELSLMKVENNGPAKWLKIKVSGNGDKVNVNVPIKLVDIAFKIAKSSNKDFDVKLNDANINIDEIVQMIKEGAEGKIVDVETEDGEKVEIVVE